MRTLSLAALLAATLVAQTTNTPGVNDLQLNYTGSFMTSTIPVTFSIGSGINLQWSGLPNSPVMLAIDTNCVPNTIAVGPGNTLDLPVSTAFQIVLDGTGAFVPSWLSQFLRTDATGYMNFNIPNAPGAGGLNYGVQGAFINPAYPAGIHLTGAFDVSGPTPLPTPNLGPASTACTPTATNLNITCDDCVTQVALGFSWTFYGVAYTEAFVSSNGNVCFGSGDATYFETVSGLLTGPARVALMWDDLAPFNTGTISFFTDNATLWEVCYAGVDEYFGLGPNTFKVTATAGAILFDYDLAMTINDGIVGLSPGNNLDPSGSAFNLGTAPNVITPGAAPYQQWDGVLQNFHLKGYEVVWTLDGAGRPILQN